MESRLAAQENVARQVEERFMRMESAITQIAEFVQQQNAVSENTRALMNSLVEEVNTHRENFQKVGLIIQTHEQHIVQNGTVTQEMAQYISALIKESEQKSLWIGSLTTKFQAQTEVLRQHQLGQQVIAEVIKKIILGQGPQQAQQQPQHQGIAENGPTVTEVDDEDPDRLDFLGGPNPHKGPPNSGSGQMTTKPPRAPKRKAKLKKY